MWAEHRGQGMGLEEGMRRAGEEPDSRTSMADACSTRVKWGNTGGRTEIRENGKEQINL